MEFISEYINVVEKMFQSQVKSIIIFLHFRPFRFSAIPVMFMSAGCILMGEFPLYRHKYVINKPMFSDFISEIQEYKFNFFCNRLHLLPLWMKITLYKQPEKKVLCILFPQLQLKYLKLGRFRVEDEFLCSPSMSGKILLKESHLCP